MGYIVAVVLKEWWGKKRFNLTSLKRVRQRGREYQVLFGNKPKTGHSSTNRLSPHLS